MKIIIVPAGTIQIELTLIEAIELQRAITSANVAPIKDRLFDHLVKLFRKEGIKGGVYV